MRRWRSYLRLALAGFVLLAILTAVLWLVRAEAAWGFLILTYYWIIFCFIVGVILLAAALLRRLAGRTARPSSE